MCGAQQAASGSGLNGDMSQFQRLAEQPGFPVVTLEEQRRMRPEVAE